MNWKRFIQIALVGRNPRRTLVRGAVLGAVVLVFFGWVCRPVRVDGESMAPTIASGRLGWVSLMVYAFRDPVPGDIVAIELAGRRVMYLKRVLARPGDIIAFTNGVLNVNGQALDEPYVLNRGSWTTPEDRMGEDEYFVVGDNRGMPMENHVMGAVRRARIVGRWLF